MIASEIKTTKSVEENVFCVKDSINSGAVSLVISELILMLSFAII